MQTQNIIPRYAEIININDKVLVRQPKKKKFTPRYNPNTYTVTAQKGSVITATRNRHNITRNISFFKWIPNKISVPRVLSSDQNLQRVEDDLLSLIYNLSLHLSVFTCFNLPNVLQEWIIIGYSYINVQSSPHGQC